MNNRITKMLWTKRQRVLDNIEWDRGCPRLQYELENINAAIFSLTELWYDDLKGIGELFDSNGVIYFINMNTGKITPSVKINE